MPGIITFWGLALPARGKDYLSRMIVQEDDLREVVELSCYVGHGGSRAEWKQDKIICGNENMIKADNLHFKLARSYGASCRHRIVHQ